MPVRCAPSPLVPLPTGEGKCNFKPHFNRSAQFIKGCAPCIARRRGDLNHDNQKQQTYQSESMHRSINEVEGGERLVVLFRGHRSTAIATALPPPRHSATIPRCASRRFSS